MEYETFVISGDGKEALAKILNFMIGEEEFNPKECGYGRLAHMEEETKGKAPVLLIGKHLDEATVDQIMPYPFQMTGETLAEQITQFISSFQLKDLNGYDVTTEEILSYADEDEVVIGWELFKPNVEAEYNVGHYYVYPVLGVKPVPIVYGK